MQPLIPLFIQNPVKVAVGVLLVALFGVLALMRMPMQLTPEVQAPKISVSTYWPGASPQEIEREIVQEQEMELKGVEGVRRMYSECEPGRGRIMLEFQVGTDMSESLVKVNTRLQQVRDYPVDAMQPTISTSDLSDRSIAWLFLGHTMPSQEDYDAFEQKHPELKDSVQPIRTAHIDELALERLQAAVKVHPEMAELLPPDIDVVKELKFMEDVVEARYERVPGVSDCVLYGGEPIEMQLVVDPLELAARQLTISDLRTALQAQNKDTTGGEFWEGKRRYIVRTLGQFISEEQVASLIVARRDGKPVYVRDVAQVRVGYKKPQRVVRHMGIPSIGISIYQENDSNALEVMQGIREATAELNADILQRQGLNIRQVYDETDYIHAAIGLVNQNIVVGGLLTVAVLLIFLRSGRSTVIIALAIPISIIGTFLILGMLGRSLNVISLAGLAFAVGMLVDNAVVVLENIYRRYQQGMPLEQAAVQGSSEVLGAVVASTLTTLAVFVPVFFVQEEAGQLFRDLALAISAAVGLSLIVSVVVIPTAAAMMLGRGGEDDEEQNQLAQQLAERFAGEDVPQGKLQQMAHRLAGGFVQYTVSLNRFVQKSMRRKLAVVGAFVVASITLTWLLTPKVEYLPSGNKNLVFARLLPPPGYNVDRMLELGQRIEDRLRPHWELQPDTAEEAASGYPAIGDFYFVAHGHEMFMGVRAADPERASELVPLVQEVASGIPGTFSSVSQSSLFEKGRGSGRNVEVEIVGPDLVRLIDLGQQLLNDAPSLIPGATAYPRSNMDLTSPEVHVLPKWEQAADMEVSASELGYTVDAFIDGAYASDFYVGGERIDLTIVGQEKFSSRLQDLEEIPITVPTGELVPLAAVASVELGGGPQQINRSERQRAVTVQIKPPMEMPLEEAIDQVRAKMIEPLYASGQLDGGYQLRMAGTADKLRDTWQALRFNVVLALLITYLLMAALFESWLYPLVVIVSVPLGAVGGLLGLELLNLFVLQPLDVLTMLGFVILIGTVVNNAILIVHQSLNYIREERLPQDEAVLRSVRSRIRPIMMTTTTTVLGLSPLVLFPGAGSELYRGLGSVVLGGLLVSTFFTLVLVPTLFSLVMELKDKSRQMLRGPGKIQFVNPLKRPVAVEQAAQVPAAEEVPVGSGSGEV